MRSLDAGELREELAEIYTHDFVALGRARRARWIIGEISRLTGITRERIQADAKADAEAMEQPGPLMPRCPTENHGRSKSDENKS